MNDKHLIDKGWRDMEALLDEHMPTPRRRRRPIVALWWLWLLLAGLGGGLWYHHRISRKPPAALPPLAPPTEMPMAAGKPASSPEVVPRISERPTLPPAPTDPTTRLEVGRHAQPPVLAVVPAGRPAMSVEATPSLKDSGETATLQMAEPASEEAFRTTAFDAEILAKPLALLPTLAATSPLPHRTLQFRPDGAGQMPASPTPRARRLSAGLSAGAFAQPGAKARGFAIGPTFDWHTGKRWGLRTGVVYRFTHLQGRSLTVNNTTHLGISALRRLSPGLLPPMTDSVWVRLSHTHRLEVPVLIYGQMTPRLRVYGGGTGGVLLGARVGEVLPISGNPPMLDVSKTGPLSSLASACLFRWEGSAVAGIGYALSPRLEVSAQAHWRFYASPDRQTTSPAVNPISGLLLLPGAKSDQWLLQISIFRKIY